MERFADREALFDAAAAGLARALSDGLDARGRAAAVLTGGQTPAPVYDRLSAADLDWRRVSLTLSDERWVETGSPDSNEGMVRRRLLTGRTAQAGFVSLKTAAADLEAGARAAAAAIRGLFPADVVLLGMGEDGHIASLFPGDPILSSALDLDDSRQVVAVPVSGLAPFTPRLSLTLAALLDARLVLLLGAGEAKATILARIGADPAYDPPAASLLRQTRTPVRVLWAP